MITINIECNPLIMMTKQPYSYFSITVRGPILYFNPA